MADRLYRLLWDDGGEMLIIAADNHEARRKRELYAPYSHVRIETSTDGGPWQLVDPGCSCCPERDTMPSLGAACEVSCGTDKYPTERE